MYPIQRSRQLRIDSETIEIRIQVDISVAAVAQEAWASLAVAAAPRREAIADPQLMVANPAVVAHVVFGSSRHTGERVSHA